jgi:hypothetical protein
MGWFSKVFGSVAKFIGIAVAVVATIVTAGLAAPLGATVLGALGAESAVAATTIVGSTTVGSVLGGTLIGSGIGAVEAAATGGNVLKGALTGGVSSAVGALAGGAISSALGGESAVGATGPQIPVSPTAFGSTALGAGLTKAGSNFAGGTLGSLAGGASLGSALKTGAISGAAGGISSGLSDALGLAGTATQPASYGDRALSALLDAGTSYGLGKAFQTGSKSSSGISSGSSGASSTATTGASSPGASQSFQLAGSPSALGSALFSAPGIGYSPGGPVLGGAGGEDKAPKNVWSDTDKSLRDVGTTVT